MALSASYDFNLTRNEIITEALRDIGVIDEGNSTPTADQLAVGVKRLNMIVKNLQVRGIFLWTEVIVATDMVASTATYTLDSKYIGVRDLVIRQSSGNDYPVEIISSETYDGIVDKATTGRPIQAMVTSAIDATTALPSLTLTLWPVPNDSTDDLRARCEKRLQDFDGATNNTDAPTWFLRPLTKILAADLGRAYGVPMDIIGDLRKEGYALLEECLHSSEKNDIEDDSCIQGYF